MIQKFDRHYLYIAFFAILFYLPFIGQVHLFDWDEINFAESAREMIVTGNYSRVQINYEPFWEKPPLFFWLQALSMKVFGINEFAARFPNVICGVLSLLTIYVIGKKIKDKKFGLFWAISLGASVLPFFYFKSGMIDPWYNYFTFISAYFILQTITTSTIKNAFFGGLFLGLAILTKGPVAAIILLITTCIYLFYTGSFRLLKWYSVVIFIVTTVLVSSIWFGYETYQNGTVFLREFINYQYKLFATPDSGHGQPFFYHFIVIFFGCFPISIFALPSLFNKTDVNKTSNNANFLLWCRILFWTVLILFSLVTTKIAHYSSLCYLPLSYIAANYLYVLSEHKKIPRFSLRVTFLIIGILLSLVFMLIPFVAAHPKYIASFINDDFVIACLQYHVNWNGYEFLFGFFLLIAIVITFFRFKKGIRVQVYFTFFSMAIFLLFYLAAIVPKIEKYSQYPAINFYKTLSTKHVIVVPVGFKSYAHYFYFKKQKPSNSLSTFNSNLIDGNIDRDIYFVTKVTHRELANKKNIFYLGRQGGFDFWYRPVKLQ